MVCLGAYASLQISMITYRETGVVEGVYSPSLGCRLMLSLYFLIPRRVLESSVNIPCLSPLPIIISVIDFFLFKRHNRDILSKCIGLEKSLSVCENGGEIKL